MADRPNILGCIIRVFTCHKCRSKHSPQNDTRPSSLAVGTTGSENEERPTSNVSRDSGVAEDFTESSQVLVKPGATVIAVYDYTPTSQEDLQFKKGDKMRVLDTSDRDWWKATHLTTQMQGFIPSNYVAATETVYCEDWYHGELFRKEAENLLLSSGTGSGTFLIRSSGTFGGSYALSLLGWDEALKRPAVKHYIIKAVAGKYSLKGQTTFNSLQELVAFYSEDPSGVDTRLITPCPKAQPHLWDLSSETKDNWEINRKDIELETVLGEGNYGKVWLGKYLGDVPSKVAVKTLKPGTMSPDAFIAEATIMKTLRHKNLVPLYAVCSKEEPIWIITEFVPHGSLLSFLRSEEGRYLDLNFLIDFATQVAHGMSYLESRQLIHRDLAARNILVGENNVIKIADFGLARVITDDVYEPSSQFACPVKWTAPEVYLQNRCTVKSDVWSFGIVLMEIVTHGANPYCGMNNTEVSYKVSQGYRMPRPAEESCPEALYDLMLRCWQKEPRNRPNFDFLYSFLNDFAVNKTQYA